MENASINDVKDSTGARSKCFRPFFLDPMSTLEEVGTELDLKLT